MLNKDKIKNEKKLAKYPPEIIEDLLDILLELSPTETWVSIWAITAKLNKNFTPGNQESKRITGVKVGSLLRLLGFNERKRIRLTSHCLVRTDILRLYRKEGV